MLTVGLLRRIDALRLGAVLLILWVCGPCGPLLDRYFAERFPDHGQTNNGEDEGPRLMVIGEDPS